MSAVPNFGGSDSHGNTGFKIMGDGPIPTPRQLVGMLDQYVIGQDKAKRVSHANTLHPCNFSWHAAMLTLFAGWHMLHVPAPVLFC